MQEICSDCDIIFSEEYSVQTLNHKTVVQNSLITGVCTEEEICIPFFDKNSILLPAVCRCSAVTVRVRDLILLISDI